MSTTLTSHASKQIETSNDNSDMSDSERYSPEVESAMIRAQQRAKLFVSQTAPQSPVHSHTSSPTGSTSGKSNVLSFPSSSSRESVKSSLKLRPGLQRANSEPSQKSVHFSTTNLVDVRKFKDTQRPSAVGQRPKFYTPSGHSRGGDDQMADDSMDTYDEDEEDMYDSEDDADDYDDIDLTNSLDYDADSLPRFKSQRYKDPTRGWTLLTPGFTPHSKGRLPGAERPDCYVETLQLASSPPSLRASVYVRNLGFEKYVALRYSINNWCSYSETQGVFSDDVRKFDRDAGFDRFDIYIPLDSLPCHELNNSSLKFCVHYIVNDCEYWDSNGGKNYEIFLRNSRLASQHRQQQQQHQQQHQQQYRQRQQQGNHRLPRPASVTGTVNLRRRFASVPQVTINNSEDEYFGHDDESDDGRNEYLRYAGVPLRSREEMKERDPFIDRYSFEASYTSAPKSPSPRVSPGPKSPIFKVSDPFANSFGNVPISVKPKQTQTQTTAQTTAQSQAQTQGRAGSPTERVQQQQPSSTASNAWESESYKELVSKYCFYTPGGNTTATTNNVANKIITNQKNINTSPQELDAMRETSPPPSPPQINSRMENPPLSRLRID